MHISAILLLNLKGDVIISRFYRNDVSEQAANNFRLKVIAAKEAGQMPPVTLIDKNSFLYLRHSNVYFVGVTSGNVNPALVFQFLKDLVSIFSSYFDKPRKVFDEASLRNNFTLVYELLDEVIDFGYPQTTAIDLLQLHINTGKMKKKLAAKQATLDTKDLTGAVDWRRDGIVHKKNECFIDVVEKIELLLSQTGDVLRNEVHGEVQMRTFLSGMPECKFGLNDKISMENDMKAGKMRARGGKKPAVSLADCTFHRCVRLGKFEDDRSITFIPPDGKFVLMNYRITKNIRNPFRILPVIQEVGGSRLQVNIKISGDFDPKLFATKVVFEIPMPPNTAICKVKTQAGRAKHDVTKKAIVWKIRKFPGMSEFKLSATADLMSSTNNKEWVRPPISAQFQINMFTGSGLQVRFLKVYEKSGYQSSKWVRYLSKAASYKLRLSS
eukprot:g1892.t1